MEKHECEGSCSEHIGDVRLVQVDGWGYFWYCEEAIAEDERRGLCVVVVQEKAEVL